MVNGNYMFVTTPMDHLIAMDATSGKVLWKYDYPIDKKALKTVCCDVVNRGVALYGDLVYMGTLGNHIVALDAKTGEVKWDTALAPPGVGYFISGAPLVVNGKVIIGDGGGEYGARGFIVGMNAETGKVEWKTYTTAAPGTPGGDTWPKGAYKTGGGNPWITGTYDHATNTLFWGVGNPGPWLATLRPGDNLYTDSVLALNPDTGKIKWYYQWTPNDTWDYDGANETVMTDLTYGGTALQGARARRSQRLVLCARSHERQAHLRRAVRAYDLHHRHERRRFAVRSGHAADDRQTGLRLPELPRRQELVADIGRSTDPDGLHSDAARLHGHQGRAAGRLQGGTRVSR